MTIKRKQITQVSIGLAVLALLIVLVIFGGGWFIETFKEMHGL